VGTELLDYRAVDIAQAVRAHLERHEGDDHWITAEDNVRARRLYDSSATAASWVTYDLTPGSL
jgi:hypothetical protein